jgi:cation diffusion facilitator family transporter
VTEREPQRRTGWSHGREHRHHTHGREHSHGYDGEHSHEHTGGLRGLLSRLYHAHSHDPGDAVDSALESSAAGVRAVKISLVVLVATAVAQAVVVALTGSVALLADTIHNFSDAFTAVPLWVAFVAGRRPATRSHTYGYGRAEDIAGVFIVLMIAASAVVAGYESMHRLVEPQPIGRPWAVIAAGLIGFAGNEMVAWYRIRVGRRIGSAALVADGLHARTDGFTSVAVVLGAAGVLLGYPLADPVVGLVISVAILLVLKDATTQIYRRLMDAVEPGLVADAEHVLGSTPGVREVEGVLLRWVGHRLRAEVGIVVDPGVSVVDGHAIATDAHHRLMHNVPKLAEATVHVSPGGPAGENHHAALAHHLQSRPEGTPGDES